MPCLSKTKAGRIQQKIDAAHIFLDFNENDSTMPSNSGGASNIIANPTRTDDY
jgi:hypothetical protein